MLSTEQEITERIESTVEANRDLPADALLNLTGYLVAEARLKLQGVEPC